VLLLALRAGRLPGVGLDHFPGLRPAPDSAIAWLAKLLSWGASAPAAAGVGAALLMCRAVRQTTNGLVALVLARRPLGAWLVALVIATALAWVAALALRQALPDSIALSPFPGAEALDAVLIGGLVWRLWSSVGPRLAAAAWLALACAASLVRGAGPSAALAGALLGIAVVAVSFPGLGWGRSLPRRARQPWASRR
jgi:hypothetical protein